MSQIPRTLDPLKVPIDGLTPYGKNPRRGNVDVIVESLQRHGQYRPIVVRAKTFEVLAGNHTLAAAQQLGWTEIAATFVDCTDDEAARIVLVDNRAADLGAYDDEVLADLLSNLDDLEGTGYTDDDAENLLAAALSRESDLPPDLDDDDVQPSRGELLSIADVSLGEPKHETHHGEVWRLGRHTLVVAKLNTEHQLWSRYLTPETLFAPYPEPYITATEAAQAGPLLLVQPDRYLAGHIIDKHASMFPDEPVGLA